MTDETAGRLLQVNRTADAGAVVLVGEEIRNGEWPGASAATRDRPPQRTRFAGEIAVWLERVAAERCIERVGVFARQPLLDALRENWSPRFAICVDEYEADLAALSPEQLACHPAVVALAGEAP